MKLIVSFLALASAQFKPKPCCVTYTIDDTREIQFEGVNYSGTYHKKVVKMNMNKKSRSMKSRHEIER